MNANGIVAALKWRSTLTKWSDEDIQDIILTAKSHAEKMPRYSMDAIQAILKELGKDVQIQFS